LAERGPTLGCARSPWPAPARRAVAAGADIGHIRGLDPGAGPARAALGDEAARLRSLRSPRPTATRSAAAAPNVLDVDEFGELFASDEAKERLAAFVEKREPRLVER
jgi:hypothetical protein